MKKVIYIILTTLLIACGSVSKVSTNAEQEIKKESFQSDEKELKNLVSTLRDRWQKMELNEENINLNLSAINSDKPAIYSEIKGKDTIYKVVVQNGVLTKNKTKKGRIEQSEILKKKESDLKERKYMSNYLQVFAKNKEEMKAIRRRQNLILIIGTIGLITFIFLEIYRFKRALKQI